MKKPSRRSFSQDRPRGRRRLGAVARYHIPSRVLGADAPSKRINVAQIGCGRMGHSDMGNVLNEPLARVVAVCDLDSKRLAVSERPWPSNTTPTRAKPA